ncbi:arginine--tRNA ligase [Candidatus Roizmanbacteria bacterium CG_4_10_14_0_2_um_filter_36_35]|uniref:Arginine--tRNA ligase n=4 Tax=Candidatus Roizmaniibacteriota TaxID=1752723 RepID=A0A2M7BXC9_9BACT|nr:MAG: arginine--tRNA ligase [Candidatus Roizmanbacteria bacterium CG11_big_fil_rev_8_21_14_0_20_35_14]PIV11214.1 MAG: arginine--tRNA ligase [Candidatus Roizmanbacteria bacterium CG03_land_8_20_14_0_80_35_26]PIZ67184.1 MAG: arginine--tRNA ligase [Candidatus Roizmanbacteria bacterium CG_4_10_14_0_2_um_filter_36_35]PJC33505.1 MAG: arginine--tRNA ligase [Candidatus Roizmanbacteria bacterium CG_4_9_14_0_2_um_filter_36_12]PJC80819.1 MAG: arginine--tRNA ligase [Candidatus Roizmanbacteria bacterium C
MIKNEILKNLKESLVKSETSLKILKQVQYDKFIDLQSPANADFGDYSTSVALRLAKLLKKNPMIIAEEIKKNFPKTDFIEQIEIIKPGFINFWVNSNYFLDYARKVSEEKFEFPSYYLGKNKKVMVEFAHPNTHKLFHIGHLRNISTGEAMVRILEAVGNKVVRSNYQGDIGLHIAKCIYGIKNSKVKSQNLKTLKEKTEFIGKMYTKGTKAYEEDSKAKEEIIKINQMIYDQDPEILPLWQKTKQWSLEYFDKVYKRVDSHFDRLYLESEITKRGSEISQEIFEKGILEKSQGAIVFNGKKYGLDIRVFVNSLGFPTYEGKELGLAEKEFSEFGELDKNIHVVTPEQTSFFKVTFKVEELIDEKKYKNKQFHLVYEWVRLKESKMSSREGNVIEADWLIDKIKEKIIKQFNCNNKTAEILGVASVKYSFLKNSTQTVIAFDIDESIAVDGNSAPYLIYTYVRCQSVLRKTNDVTLRKAQGDRSIMVSSTNHDELNLLRKFYQFPEVVLKTAENYSPNFIATYIYGLASQFNLFYQKNPILKSEKETKELRLLITLTTAKIIKKGLELLGIKTVEKM